MNYFEHPFVSNSDLKQIVARANGKTQPDNLQEIFDDGSLNHHALLEPHKADEWLKIQLLHPEADRRKSQAKYDRAKAMAATVLKDPFLQKLIMMPDFKREHEHYKSNMFGLKGIKCKCDGESRSLSAIFEYKGLALTTDKQFGEALEFHDYDQSAFWYLNTTGYTYYPIVGVSKQYTDRLFKRLITRDHPLYQTGEIKAIKAIGVWKDFGLE